PCALSHPPKQDRERRLPTRLSTVKAVLLTKSRILIEFMHNVGSRLHPLAGRRRSTVCCDRRLLSGWPRARTLLSSLTFLLLASGEVLPTLPGRPSQKRRFPSGCLAHHVTAKS